MAALLTSSFSIMKFFNFLKNNPFFTFLIAFALLILSWFVNDNPEKPEKVTPSRSNHSAKSSPTPLPDYQPSSSPEPVSFQTASQLSRSSQAEMQEELDLPEALALFAEKAELNPGEISDARMLRKALSNLQAVANEEATAN